MDKLKPQSSTRWWRDYALEALGHIQHMLGLQLHKHTCWQSAAAHSRHSGAQARRLPRGACTQAGASCAARTSRMQGLPGTLVYQWDAHASIE